MSDDLTWKSSGDVLGPFVIKYAFIPRNLPIRTRLTGDLLRELQQVHGPGVVRDDHLDQVTPLGRLNRIDAFDLATHRREST